MSLPPPSFYDDLMETLAEAWRLIARGVADRRSPFHHPTVATVGLDGFPQARTVILRACDVPARRLRFHTDARSMKIAETTADPRAAIHFYDPGAKIQLRLAGELTPHRDGAIADEAWAGSRVFSRQCYSVMPGPGVPLAAGGDFTLPDVTDAATAGGRANFVAVTFDVQRLEWLYLAAAGHRRARFDFTGEAPAAVWLTP
jgi:pyridoxamine 5'-phosphate oxidase